MVSPDTSVALMIAAVATVVLLVVFVVFREVVCWYWKINESMELQRTQIARLNRIIEALERQSPPPRT